MEEGKKETITKPNLVKSVEKLYLFYTYNASWELNSGLWDPLSTSELVEPLFL